MSFFLRHPTATHGLDGVNWKKRLVRYHRNLVCFRQFLRGFHKLRTDHRGPPPKTTTCVMLSPFKHQTSPVYGDFAINCITVILVISNIRTI